MATYVISDVHACIDPLIKLLDLIQFDDSQDDLIFIGDLVNRGPDSVKTLNFVKGLGARARAILGNHDLALLALSVGAIKASKKDTFDEVLKADNKDELLSWLRTFPLIIQHTDGTIITHAGLYPLWSVQQAIKYSDEVTKVLISDQFESFMHHMFGQEPLTWTDHLQGWDRLRFITNAFTRMRYCTVDGALEFDSKHSPKTNKTKAIPWFEFPNPKWQGTDIIFGHWASLEGKCPTQGIEAIDTGCVWGGCLTAYCLESKQRFHIDCK